MLETLVGRNQCSLVHLSTLAPWCLASREERAHRHREAATTQKAPTGETQAHNTNNNTQQHDHHTTTHPRVAVCTIPHHRPCLSLSLDSRLLSSASCLCFCLVRLASSVCLDVRVFVLSVTVILKDALCESTSVCFPKRW